MPSPTVPAVPKVPNQTWMPGPPRRKKIGVWVCAMFSVLKKHSTVKFVFENQSRSDGVHSM